MDKEIVSIILATLNRSRTVRKAIDSVLSQTYRDFEFIIIDDGSMDDTLGVLRSYNDSRIRIIENKENLGFVKSLNKAIKLARGEFIARIDDDDYWCDNAKLEKQIKFLENNPEYVLVGCGMIKNGIKYLFKEKDKEIRKTMLLADQFVHPGVVFKKDTWEAAGKYDEKFFFSQDWDLWMRLGKIGKMYNFQEYFVCVSEDGNNRTSKRMRYHLMLNQKIRWRYRKDYPGFLKAYIIGFIVCFLPFQKQLKKFLKYNGIKECPAKAGQGKIKVCQVVTIPFAIRFLLLDQIKNLQKKGYKVSAVCSPGKWIEEIEAEGVFVKTIKITRRVTPFLDLFSLIKLIIYFRKEKFDIVHTNTPKPGLIGTLAARIAGVPIIIHSNLGFYFQRDSSWLKKKFFLWIEKITANNSDLVFSVAKTDIELGIKQKIYSSDKIKYLGGWVNLDKFNLYELPQEFIEKKKRELKISDQAKVIGINARLVRDKGYYELFEAFKEVLKLFPETILLIIGSEEPEKKDRINPESVFKEFNIEKNVIFLGERTDVEKIYPVMDIFVLPSYREGVGISILEASAMERPIIASNTGGCPEAVDDGKTGILVPLKNIEKLTEAIIYLLKNPEVGKEMGRKGRQKVLREFNEQLVFERLEKEYNRLISEKL